MLWVRVGAKVALREDKHPRRTHGFELVKGVAYNCKPASFSDSTHYCLQVTLLGDPHTVDMTDEMQHILSTVAYFIYDQGHGKCEPHHSSVALARLGLVVAGLHKVRDADGAEYQGKQNQKQQVKGLVRHITINGESFWA